MLLVCTMQYMIDVTTYHLHAGVQKIMLCTYVVSIYNVIYGWNNYISLVCTCTENYKEDAN